MKLFVSIPKNRKEFIDDSAKEYLNKLFDVEYLELDRQLTEEEFSKRVKDYDVVLTSWNHCKITYDMLRDTNVKVIAHTGGTVAYVADLSLFDNGVKVLSANSIFAESVAEGTIGYMLTGLRNIPYYVNEMKNGRWKGEKAFSQGLLNQTVGIIGLGAVAKNLIKMLQVFNVKIKIYDTYKIDEEYLKENNAEISSLEEIFSTCKIITVHAAMTEKTRGMIGKELFDLMKENSIFINTARGSIVKEDEMIDALKKKQITAVLDVYCSEPLLEDSELRKLDNAYCIPHMGGPTADRYTFVTKSLADNILKVMAGENSELEISRESASRMTFGE